MKALLRSRTLQLVINILLVVSIVLLFVTKLIRVDADTLRVLEIIDYLIIAVFSLEFTLKLIFLGRSYFFAEFGWIDLLACLPILSPLFIVFEQLRALRMARLIRFVRLLRIIRLFKALSLSEESRERIKARFFLSITSVTLIVILSGAVIITFVVDRFLSEENLSYHALILEQLGDERAAAYLADGTLLYASVVDAGGRSLTLGSRPPDDSGRVFGRREYLVYPDDFPVPAPRPSSPGLRVDEAVFSNSSASDLLSGLELVIMTTSLVAALVIIGLSNRFLGRNVTRRIRAVNEHIDAVFLHGEKLPMRVDEIDDEISDLQKRVNRITDFHIV